VVWNARDALRGLRACHPNRSCLRFADSKLHQHPTQVGIAVVEHQGRFLVGRRGPDGPLPGLAEFPGGKCAPEELPDAAAVRECLEETDLSVVADRELAVVAHDYPYGCVELHFWHCRPADADDVRDEHRGFRWAPLAELSSLPFPEANAAVVRALSHPDYTERGSE
jgi:8-oxo-dGTP diphosphatase